ncbi:MAG: hypothetical protein KJ868_00180, partial [Gammaproteobacteria bacterium]|nr:hypothetical protein [Gammaproteobacteria bacterium]
NAKRREALRNCEREGFLSLRFGAGVWSFVVSTSLIFCLNYPDYAALWANAFVCLKVPLVVKELY